LAPLDRVRLAALGAMDHPVAEAGARAQLARAARDARDGVHLEAELAPVGARFVRPCSGREGGRRRERRAAQPDAADAAPAHWLEYLAPQARMTSASAESSSKMARGCATVLVGRTSNGERSGSTSICSCADW